MNPVQRFCTFYLGSHFFGVEVLKVQEVVRDQELSITRVPLANSVISGLINLRGQIVTAIDLRRRLGLPDRGSDERMIHVVIDSTEGPASLLVDRIGDVIEITNEVFEKVPDTLQGPSRDLIRGAFVLKDRLLVTLDTARILDLQRDAA